MPSFRTQIAPPFLQHLRLCHTFQSFRQLRRTPRKLDSLEKQCWEDSQQRENRQKMWVVIRSEVFGEALRKTSMWNHWLDLRGRREPKSDAKFWQTKWMSARSNEWNIEEICEKWSELVEQHQKRKKWNMEMETASEGESCQKTRSPKMSVAPYGSIIHLKSTDHLDQ